MRRELVVSLMGLLGRAWASLLGSMGTTTMAIVVGLLVVPLLVALIKLLRQGPASMRQAWKENLRDTVVVTMAVWLLLFAYHLLYRVPRDIYRDAAAITLGKSKEIPAPQFLSSSRQTHQSPKAKREDDDFIPCINSLRFEQHGSFYYTSEPHFRQLVRIHPQRFKQHVSRFVLFHLTREIAGGLGLGVMTSATNGDPAAAGLSVQSGNSGVIVRDNRRYAELWISDQAKFSASGSVLLILWGDKPFKVACAQQLPE